MDSGEDAPGGGPLIASRIPQATQALRIGTPAMLILDSRSDRTLIQSACIARTTRRRLGTERIEYAGTTHDRDRGRESEYLTLFSRVVGHTRSPTGIDGEFACHYRDSARPSGGIR